MALTTIRYGRYVTAPEADFGEIASGQMRACVFNASANNLWVISMGVWAGRNTATNVTLRLGLYETNASNNPTTRVGYTAAITVSTSKTSASGGAANVGNVAVADSSPSNSAIMLSSGKRYSIAILGTGASLNHSMRQASAITADNEQFYNRSGLSQPPPAPFGSYSASTQGHLSAWATGYLNEAPLAPSSLSPTGAIDSLTPTFTGAFQDLNGAYGTSSGNGVDTGDKLKQYAVELRAQGTTTLLWSNTYTADASEQSANAFTRAYGGSALTRGTTYEYRWKVSDQFGEFSAWSSWTTFTPSSLGVVVTDNAPTGKIETNQPTFYGRWSHQNALSTNAVRVRLYDASDALLQDSGWITKTVTSSSAPGTLFSVSFADTGFTNLTYGVTYKYEIAGRDTNNAVSNYSSPLRSFNTNAAPSVPSGLSPANSSIYTAYPLLKLTATDVDDTTATGLVVDCRIKNNSGTVLFTRSMTYNATSGFWEYQTTGTDLASYATYRWDAVAYDGTLYSGGVSSLGSATYATEAVFVYAQGPTVTMGEPDDGDTVTTSALTVTWTTTNQNRYKVTLYADGTSSVVYASGWIVSATSSHNIPSGYIQNGVSYDLVVTVEDTTPLEGSSGIIDISASFTPPAALTNVFAETFKPSASDPWANAVAISWEQSADAGFSEYVVRRSANEGPDAAEIVLARITSIGSTSFSDYTPASGYVYTYSVSQVSTDSGESLESERVAVYATVTMGGIVLSAIGASGGTYRAAIRYTAERDEERTLDEAVYTSLAGGLPQTIRSRVRYRTFSFDAKLVDDSFSSGIAKKNELAELDQADSIVCYRDNHGRKAFCKIVECSFTDMLPDWFTVRLSLREETYTESIE